MLAGECLALGERQPDLEGMQLSTSWFAAKTHGEFRIDLSRNPGIQ